MDVMSTTAVSLALTCGRMVSTGIVLPGYRNRSGTPKPSAARVWIPRPAGAPAPPEPVMSATVQESEPIVKIKQVELPAGAEQLEYQSRAPVAACFAQQCQAADAIQSRGRRRNRVTIRRHHLVPPREPRCRRAWSSSAHQLGNGPDPAPATGAVDDMGGDNLKQVVDVGTQQQLAHPVM